jgi:POT family proton-dependent oligopeptide transporter
LLTPVLIRFWRAIRAKETTPDLLRRMSIGCVIGAASMLVLVAAAMASGADAARVSPWWTIGYFLLLTVGELLVIPVGLTLIETLAPARVASTAMGGWYIAKFLGSLLAGAMGAYWGVIPATMFFGLGASSVLAAAIFLLVLSRMRPIRLG